MKNAKIHFFLYRHQRNKLRLDDVPKLPEWQRLRHQHSSTDMTVPNLVIRRASLVPAPHDLTGRKIPTATSVQTTNSEGTVFENHPKCLAFEFFNFGVVHRFVKLTCLVTLFDCKFQVFTKMTILGIFFIKSCLLKM